ncbi:MAG: hypothetical protein HND56_03615 [Pseudomonadota bacterium]|nr:hypothetical protein [Pseudomonadota bacterium]QKK04832.1 MAG: hypothetical protein HND56_03615 [Pseudomonadota bacterium]
MAYKDVGVTITNFLLTFWEWAVGFLSPDFMTAAIGSAFGAFGGAYCVWFLNKSKEREKSLSQINQVLAMLIANLNALLNVKKNYALPAYQELSSIMDAIDSNQQYSSLIQKIFNQFLEVHYDTTAITENLSLYAYLDSKTLVTAVKVKDALRNVEEITKLRNLLIQDIRSDPASEDDKVHFYLGYTNRNGKTDSRLQSATEGFLLNIDIAIHFIDLLIPQVQALGKSALPKSYAKKIIKHTIEDDFKELVPPKDFLDTLSV